MHVQGKRRNSSSHHVFPDHHREKYSSCSTIFLDNSTICQPDTRISVQCLVLAIYYHIKKRDGDRSKDIFDERLHPLTQEAVPEENFDRNPDPETIYGFIRPFFNDLNLTAEFSITTLIYLERLTVYAEIDICPTNWRRIVLGAILLAAKYLRDWIVRNYRFCQIHQGITLKDINELETQYLFLLRFRLHVSASVYAKYYFDLRSLASDHKLPNEFACLRKERAQALEGWTARDAASGKDHRRCCRRSWDRGTAAQKQRRGREKKQPLLEKNELSQETGFKREGMGQYTSDDRGQDGRHCEPKNMKS